MRTWLMTTASVVALAAAPFYGAAVAQDTTTTQPNVTITTPDNQDMHRNDGAMDAAGNALEETGDAAMDAGRSTADAVGDAAERAGDRMDAATTDIVDTTVVVTGEAVTTLPADTFLSDELAGQPVRNAAGDNLADVETFAMTTDGQITHVLIGFGGFLGIGEKEVLLPFNEFAISKTEDGPVFALELTEEEIDALPEFERPDRDEGRDTMVTGAAEPGMATGGTEPMTTETAPN